MSELSDTIAADRADRRGRVFAWLSAVAFAVSLVFMILVIGGFQQARDEAEQRKRDLDEEIRQVKAEREQVQHRLELLAKLETKMNAVIEKAGKPK